MTAATVARVGFTVLKTEISDTTRPIQVDLWYPAVPSTAETVFPYQPGSIVRVALDADPAPGASPLVLLSPGIHGSARNYTWLTEALARHGIIVAAISHHDESPTGGSGAVDAADAGPIASPRGWSRPRDCSAALDFVLAHPSFGGAADPSRIGAVGHANGGAAVLALAGGVFDPTAMEAYCHSPASRDDRGCEDADEPRAGIERANGSLRDERVRAVAALDPSLGPGHNARSLSRIKVPVHIVATVEGDFLPFEHHAGRYARLIPGASLTPLAHGEGHFVFLDECSSREQVAGVPVCRDREGVERSAVHARLSEILARFFTEHLR